MIEWIFSPWFWVTSAAILLAIEVALGILYFLLPFAFGAFVTGVALWLDTVILWKGRYILDTWELVLTVFAVLSLVGMIVFRTIRKLQHKSEPPDPNDY